MTWIQQHVPMIGSLVTVTSCMSVLLYLALTNRLDDRYMKEKDCDISRESLEKRAASMVGSIKEDIKELKDTNKTIFDKIDTINEHILELVRR